MKLNLSELIEGFFFGLSIFLIVKLWALPIAVISAFLWAISGEGYSKLYRRLGCGALVFGAVTIQIHNLQWLYGILPVFGVLSLGYGVPSGTDKGSLIGRVVYLLANGDVTMTNVVTRLTIGTLLSISLLPFYFIHHIYPYTIWYMISVGKIISIFCPQKQLSIGE